LVLRHKPETIGLVLDKNGWVEVKKLLRQLPQHALLNMIDLEEIVATNNKNRFEFNEGKIKIRARQGHSINVDLGLEPKVPPCFLYHGTATRFVDSIKKKGLIKGSRQHVHLSSDHETAVKVGGRHGKVVVLTVKAQDMSEKGFVFYLSNNGVWLTDHVPFEYLCFDYQSKVAHLLRGVADMIEMPNDMLEPRAVASRAPCSCSDGFDPDCQWEGHHHAN